MAMHYFAKAVAKLTLNVCDCIHTTAAALQSGARSFPTGTRWRPAIRMVPARAPVAAPAKLMHGVLTLRLEKRLLANKNCFYKSRLKSLLDYFLRFSKNKSMFFFLQIPVNFFSRFSKKTCCFYKSRLKKHWDFQIQK